MVSWKLHQQSHHCLSVIMVDILGVGFINRQSLLINNGTDYLVLLPSQRHICSFSANPPRSCVCTVKPWNKLLLISLRLWCPVLSVCVGMLNYIIKHPIGGIYLLLQLQIDLLAKRQTALWKTSLNIFIVAIKLPESQCNKFCLCDISCKNILICPT